MDKGITRYLDNFRIVNIPGFLYGHDIRKNVVLFKVIYEAFELVNFTIKALDIEA